MGPGSQVVRSLPRPEIPLDRDFSITVQGAAFKNSARKLLLDTGSAAFCVARSSLDMNSVSVIQAGVRYPWGEDIRADLVQADVEVVTAGGTVVSVKCPIFAAHDDNAMQLVGGFPTPGSLPYILANQHPGVDANNEQTVGYGFVSKTGTDIATGLSTFTPHLMYTPQDSVLKDVEWARTIPAYDPMVIAEILPSEKPITFAPHAIPGFNLRLESPEGAESSMHLEFNDLDATIDTGARNSLHGSDRTTSSYKRLGNSFSFVRAQRGTTNTRAIRRLPSRVAR